jgi:tripartite-type tricarboxylate transporter receptor subunit TctC
MVLSNPWDFVPIMAAQNPCPQVAGKRLRWIVPHALGGGYDTISRLIEPFYEKVLGAEIVVENVLGAGGVVGARTLAEAKPDGLTMGILNGPGLMVAALAGDKKVPNPATDFTIFARVARTRHVWVTGRRSPFNTMKDVFQEAEKRPIVFGTRGVGELSFINIVITSYLLGIDAETVTGYSGSRASVLAALRGEVDLVSQNFESILSQIENDDVRPLLQVSDVLISSHSSLEGVSLLGGEKGLAIRRAEELGQDVEEALANVRALTALNGVGRLIVAPLEMDADLRTCLEETLLQTLSNSDFKDAIGNVGYSLDIAARETVIKGLQFSSEGMDKFVTLIRESMRKVRK